MHFPSEVFLSGLICSTNSPGKWEISNATTAYVMPTTLHHCGDFHKYTLLGIPPLGFRLLEHGANWRLDGCNTRHCRCNCLEKGGPNFNITVFPGTEISIPKTVMPPYLYNGNPIWVRQCLYIETWGLHSSTQDTLELSILVWGFMERP